MGSLESRLGAMEEELIDSLMVEMMVGAEIQAILAILKASDEIERPLYEKVVRILSEAGYVAEVGLGA